MDRTRPRIRQRLGFAAVFALLLGALVTPPALAAPAAGANQNSVVATFNVTAHTQWGQQVYVTGNRPELGSWNPDKAVPLSSASYPTWSATVLLPADTKVEYKYVIKAVNAPVIWESGPNRTTVTPPTGTYITNETFRN
ncbi:CBM20 domain-containing protein [Streptomyces sp. TRM76323]|uniref:alpha-amylase n=1 Tax=Streptomyces tamarix TaxID=3078565 RepID=A0ABU3QI04_9ACTN|nr:CBM20 domain-containing protein [Streptomyces tamarix]MDT9682400.1 CBM20 domain-containing protein [Streptomyces tamarix]